MIDKINWKFPQNQTNREHFSPWYVILWRLLFMPTLVLGALLMVFSVFFMYGKNEAKRFWRNSV